MGFEFKVITSDNTGGGEIEAKNKGNCIRKRIAEFISETLLDGFGYKEYTRYTSDTLPLKGYIIGKKNADNTLQNERFYTYPYADSGSATSYMCIKSDKFNSEVSGLTFSFQNSTSSSGAGKVTIAYIKGINGDVMWQMLSYGDGANFTEPQFMYLNATNPETGEKAKFICENYSTSISYMTSDNSIYTKPQSHDRSSYGFFMSGSSYDMMVPMPVSNTPYVFDNLYMFTNNIRAVGKIITDGSKKYAVMQNKSNSAWALRIE